MTTLPQSSMLAARYHGPAEGFTLEEQPVPLPRAGEVLLRVLAAGICHTELHLLEGDLNPGVVPLTPGHEIAGEVAAVAEDVHDWSPGRRAVVYYYAACGECRWCRSGQEQLCPNVGRQIGFTADGGYAQYVIVPARSLVPLPDSLHPAEACTLGCSAATALHAVRAIAELRLGEAAVVYGVGAVGYALVQMARLAGARVIAVGRTPAKLELARELGADVVIDATQQDAVAAVQVATGGQGADAVFDLVASRQTMDDGIRMLARRGRLVLVGYGDDPLVVNPLLLVLRETQIRAAVGNSYRELVEVVELAAHGQYRSLVARVEPLERVNDLLGALSRGALLGRAVLAPNEPLPPLPDRRPEPAIVAHDAAGPPPSTPPLEQELLAVIARGLDSKLSEDEFDALARQVFAYQYALNEPYRRFCDLRGVTPDTLPGWRSIPAVPIAAFKETTLVCEPVAAADACFMSSGTTRADQRSRHYHPNLRVYDANAAANWRAHLLPDLPDGRRMRLLILNPPPDQLRHSSLAHYLDLMRQRFGAAESAFYVGPAGLDLHSLQDALRRAEAAADPVCVLGATFAFVHLLDRCAEDGITFRLPEGSRVMDTGGVKGKSREIGRSEFLQGVVDRFALPKHHIVNMYGLTELSTQFLDATLRDHVAGRRLPRYKTVPPWARTRVLDPETLEEVAPGEIGLLCHLDLANRASVSAILSEDLGYELGEGFEIVGRVRGSEARGCSIALDELLQAVR
ncbi:MAG TPA: alcohol dehydrogenase catalytic domain-containing protein [Thermomicrobiaceae bacterium]|nr:alcohol dehydrogenase catalytic domain-containing protein [Thermomicrobiaceae bacterium]